MKMRKVFMFCALVAGIAMMTGCQKEQGTITLKAVISQDSKAYIGDGNYPYWHTSDLVKINNVQYGFAAGTVDGTYATISDVTTSTSGYDAIFPSGIVNSMANGSASITLSTVQNYQVEAGQDGQDHQRLDIPMAARAIGNTFYFKNLCSVIRVTVNNNTGSDLTVNSIIVTVSGVNISGNATVTFGETPTLVMDESEEINHTVILQLPNLWSQQNIGNGRSKVFDIIVPPFSDRDTYIRVETTNNKHYQVKVTGATLSRSTIQPISLTVTNQELDDDGPAILKPGPQIKAILEHYQATNIVFQYHMQAPTSGVFSRIDLENDHCTPVYAIVNGTTLNIRTMATDVYANPDCSHMFENVGADLSNSFDEHFKTDLVEDMSYMFANNPSMTSIGNLNSFNTHNVTTMAYMFAGDQALGQLNFFSEPEDGHTYTFPYPSTNNSELTNMEGMFSGCSALQGLDMRYFNTGNVTNMKDLFNGCASMGLLHINNFDMTNDPVKTDMCSGLGSTHTHNNPCQIYCTSVTQGKISTGTGLDPYVVNFNTVSK